MNKTALLFLPLFVLLLMGAGCNDSLDPDANTTTPTLENNTIPMYEINLDSGQYVGQEGANLNNQDIEIEYTEVNE
jgi:hypothetical protein